MNAPSTSPFSAPSSARNGRREAAQTDPAMPAFDGPFRQTLSAEAEFVLLGSRVRLEGERAERFDRLLERGQPFPGDRRRAGSHQSTVPLNWALVVFLCSKHRVTGLVGRHLNARNWKFVPADVVVGMNRYFSAMALHSATIAGELLRVSGYLEQAGVPVVSFKGPTLALALYGNGAVRPSADLDLLVPRAHVRRAHELLRGLGYAHEVELSPSQERQHLRVDSVFNLFRDAPKPLGELFPDGFAVELHWAITSPCLPFDFTYQSVEKGLRPLEVRGQLAGVPTLSPHDLLLVLAVHGAKHLWERLLWLCDIAQLLERHPDLDWNAVLSSARKHEIERMMVLCLSLARDVMGSHLPPFVEEWLSSQPSALRLASRLRTALLWHEPEEMLRARGLEALGTSNDEEDVPPTLGANSLLAQTIDRPWKRVGFYVHLATTPSARERASVTLPPGLDALWWVLQPFHALQKRLGRL